MQIGEEIPVQCRISSTWSHLFVEHPVHFWNCAATALSFLEMMHLGGENVQLDRLKLSFDNPRVSDLVFAEFRCAMLYSTKAFDSSDEGYDGLLVGVVAVSGTGGAFAARKARMQNDVAGWVACRLT